jgi:hypothetical protein
MCRLRMPVIAGTTRSGGASLWQQQRDSVRCHRETTSKYLAFNSYASSAGKPSSASHDVQQSSQRPPAAPAQIRTRLPLNAPKGDSSALDCTRGWPIEPEGGGAGGRGAQSGGLRWISGDFQRV